MDPYASDGTFREIQKASHKDFVCQFNQEITRVESNGHYALNDESESFPIRSVASPREDEGDGTSTDKTSQSRDSTDLDITLIMGEVSSSGM